MFNERSLLERLADPRPDAPRTIRQNDRQLVASVLDHLAKMLNTRRGNAPVAADYGLPDIVDLVHSFPDSVRAMEQAIRTTIERHEPRLRSVRVRHIPADDDVFNLHFEVTAVLAGTEKRSSIRFETKVASNGGVSVRS